MMTQKLYDKTVRDHLPKKLGLKAGVAIRDTPLLDQTDTKPTYKKGLIDAIHDHVNLGDRVELVGFGRGVSSAHILLAGASHLVAHEASEEMIETALDNLERNCIPTDRIEIKHSLVGEGVEIYGSADSAQVISPSELSDADVLVMDCEGSEISILSELGELPDRIICETHPERGHPTEEAVEAISDRCEISLREYTPGGKRGKNVLVGVLDG